MVLEESHDITGGEKFTLLNFIAQVNLWIIILTQFVSKTALEKVTFQDSGSPSKNTNKHKTWTSKQCKDNKTFYSHSNFKIWILAGNQSPITLSSCN